MAPGPSAARVASKAGARSAMNTNPSRNGSVGTPMIAGIPSSGHPMPNTISKNAITGRRCVKVGPVTAPLLGGAGLARLPVTLAITVASVPISSMAALLGSVVTGLKSPARLTFCACPMVHSSQIYKR
jgi:hypothetical protein